MPEIPLGVTLENSCDREMVDRGHSLDVDVRRTAVEAIVDTGIVSLLIPEEVANELGLRRRGTRTVVSADERHEHRLAVPETAGSTEELLIAQGTLRLAHLIPAIS